MIAELKQNLGLKHPIVVRGITSGSDALKAVQSGADGIWITNQGQSKHFDSLPPAIDILSEVNEALKQAGIANCELLYSGGIRRGTDVLKAIAYGAKAVFLDPETIYWALAHEQSISNLLTMMDAELKLCMVLTHCYEVSEITEK